MNWAAKWIWDGPSKEITNCYVEFRKQFDLSTKTDRTLHVSGSQEYLLFINGQMVGRGPSPCSPEWQYYDSYSVDKYLHIGSNVISVVCYHFGEEDIIINQMQGPGGFFLQLNEEDGKPLISSDESWKCRRSPRYVCNKLWESNVERISRWGGFKEIYIAKEEDGWENTDYDDSNWNSAEVIAEAEDSLSAWKHLVPREIPFLHVEKISPKSVVRVEQNFGTIEQESELLQANGAMTVDAVKPYSYPGVVYDFEKEVVGRPILTVHAPEGGVIRIAYGESLELQYVDTFLLKEGRNELKPFGRRAFRFIQLSFMATPKPVQVESFSFELTHYPFKESGSFETNDAYLNKIWDISRYTTIMNSHDHLEDCPWREKALWIADAIVMGRTIYTIFGDQKLLRKCLIQGARIQKSDGFIPSTGPETNSMLHADFCAYWMIGVHDYWKYTNDSSLIEQIWDNLTKLIDWFSSKEEEKTGLIGGSMGTFIDWTGHIDRRDKITFVSCIYYAALVRMAEMAKTVGHDSYSKDVSNKARTLRKSIRSLLWNPEHQAFVDCMDGDVLSDNITIQTNFMAIWAGVMGKEEAIHYINENYDQKGKKEVKGAFYQHIVLEVFYQMNMQDKAMDLIKSYWGEMVSRGATTWWETFDFMSPACTIPSAYQGNTPTYLMEGIPVSLCHGWGAAPGYILPMLVLGVDVLDLGSGVVRLTRPIASDLSWAKGEFPTKYGSIYVEWTKENQTVQGKVKIPQSLKYEASADHMKCFQMEKY